MPALVIALGLAVLVLAAALAAALRLLGDARDEVSRLEHYLDDAPRRR